MKDLNSYLQLDQLLKLSFFQDLHYDDSKTMKKVDADILRSFFYQDCNVA